MFNFVKLFVHGTCPNIGDALINHVAVSVIAVREYERKQLLERVERQGATIGASIPDEITIQESSVALRDFVFEIRRRETYPKAERERIRQAKRNLRRARRMRLHTLQEGSISRKQGETLADEIIGIDRALNALDELSPEIEQEASEHQVESQKRWVRFLKQVLGNDPTQRREKL